jgi:hypothetical protein
MRIGTDQRRTSLLLVACYVLAITAAPLFHNHAIEHGEGCCHDGESAHGVSTVFCHGGSGEQSSGSQAPKSARECPSDGSRCFVCQFFGQKPAPVSEIALPTSAALVQGVSLLTPPRVAAGVCPAWHSRAPPLSA